MFMSVGKMHSSPRWWFGVVTSVVMAKERNVILKEEEEEEERVNKTKLLGLYFTSIWLYVDVCVSVLSL